MKIRTIAVTITETLNMGNYETITPQVQMSAELDPSDDVEKCTTELHTQAAKAWARNALVEIGWVLTRRADDSTKKHEFIQATSGTRQSLKKLITG